MPTPLDTHWLDVDDDHLPDYIYGYIRSGNKVYTVPALPYIDIDDAAIIRFHGPLLYNVYGCTTLSPRGQRLIAYTLARDPTYFDKLAAMITTSNSLSPVASITMPPSSKKRARNA